MRYIKKLEFLIFREDKWAAELKTLEDKVDRELDDLLKATPHAKIDEVIEKLKERRSNLFVQPEFTPIVISISGQILGFGSAGVALMIGFADKIPKLSDFWKHNLLFIGIFYMDLVIISLIALIWFFIQSRTRYPFLYLNKLGNTTPYFYIKTLNPKRKLWLWMPLQLPRTVYAANKAYLEDLKGYVNYYMHEDNKEKLKVELLQFYLLINYQGFLDAYELQLDNIFLYGLFGALTSLLALYIF